jgi:hypothetical protein
MGEEAGRVNPQGFDIQNFGIADGKPTSIKYRAKAWSSLLAPVNV